MDSRLMHLHSLCWLAALYLAPALHRHLCSLDQVELLSLHVGGHTIDYEVTDTQVSISKAGLTTIHSIHM